MQPRAIVFDLDGTLVDSLDDIAAALVAALADHDLPAPSRDQVRGWIGGGAGTLVKRALAAGGRDELVEPVLARFRVHYAAAPVIHTRVYAGLPAVLDRMVSAGRTLAVLTNKPQDLAARICEALLAPWPFAVIAGQRPGVPLKPSAEPALRVAAELGVAPDACALVGDAGTDVETAHAAGMIAVGVSWGFRPRAELAGAALVCDEPAQLVALVAS
jgi:phosphoglycolate phosphatase